VKVWRVEGGSFEEVNTLQGPGEDIEWISWHPKGSVLLAGSRDCTCWMWSVPKGKTMQCFAGHTGPLTCGGFTPDGKVVVTASEDGTLKAWNPKTGAAKTTFRDKPGSCDFHDAPVTCMAIGADSKTVLTGGVDHKIILSNLVSGKVLQVFEGHEDGIESVSVCAAMPLAASASLDGTVRVWDLEEGTERLQVPHRAGATIVRWHPLLPVLFSGSLDRTVQVSDGRDGAILHVFTGHCDSVLDLAVNPAGEVLLTGSDDQTARLFRLPPLPT